MLGGVLGGSTPHRQTLGRAVRPGDTKDTNNLTHLIPSLATGVPEAKVTRSRVRLNLCPSDVSRLPRIDVTMSLLWFSLPFCSSFHPQLQLNTVAAPCPVV